MFEQFLPNKNKMLQCRTIFYSILDGAKSGQLNMAQEALHMVERRDARQRDLRARERVHEVQVVRRLVGRGEPAVRGPDS
jgi:hypothetical protein